MSAKIVKLRKIDCETSLTNLKYFEVIFKDEVIAKVLTSLKIKDDKVYVFIPTGMYLSEQFVEENPEYVYKKYLKEYKNLEKSENEFIFPFKICKNKFKGNLSDGIILPIDIFYKYLSNKFWKEDVLVYNYEFSNYKEHFPKLFDSYKIFYDYSPIALTLFRRTMPELFKKVENND